MSNVISPEHIAVSSQSQPRIRLNFLDGLRGLSALYVVMFHAYETSGESRYGGVHTNLSAGLVSSLQWLFSGHIAVVVFIALSGYCLMMPVAINNVLPGGFSGYIMRRARRILPPYFAALGISLLLIAIVPGLGQQREVYWDQTLPAFSSGSLLSHLFLFQNVTPWSARINYPLWTVATEWQIYFLLPLLFLPVLKRWGLLAMLLVAVFLSLGPHYIFHGRFDHAAPEFIGVFALGAAGALINFSPQHSSLLHKLPWRAIAAVSMTLLILTMCFKASLLTNRQYLVDLLVGAIITSLLIYCTACATNHAKPQSSRLLKVLEAPLLTFLGTFSYSLYLMHAPILAIAHLGIHQMKTTPVETLILLLSFGVAASLIGSYLFYLACERPFLTQPRVKR